MKLRINGEENEVPTGWTVRELLTERALKPTLVAVERNGQIVTRAHYDTTVLEEGDVLEIVSFFGGG